jgi:hypothetical protein
MPAFSPKERALRYVAAKTESTPFPGFPEVALIMQRHRRERWSAPPSLAPVIKVCLALGLLLIWTPFAGAQVRSSLDVRCIAIELYLGSEQEDAFRVAVEKFVNERKGLSLRVYQVHQEAAHAERLATICKYFQKPSQTPAVYGCGRLVQGGDPARIARDLQTLTTFEVFVRAGCPRCASAKAYLPSLLARFPGFALRLREISGDALANRDLQELTRQHRTAAASVPVFHVCNQLTIGFDSAATTGKRLAALLERWTVVCRPEANQVSRPTVGGSPWLAVLALGGTGFSAGEAPESDALPLPDAEELPLPSDASDTSDASQDGDAPSDDAIDLPVLGHISRSALGLPLFTIAVGLVDGFNPCAMWVLLFLLSVLVNLHSRWKIVAVAGTFVVISGLAYLAFMAAWLNVFLWVGLLPWVRIVLATLAIAIGVIHVKDFFAFKQGISLSIPESAKPGIYARVRKIVTAENVAGAVAGAAVLAVLVNMIELLCTSGLPALYTQILTAQRLPMWLNYSYLLLYIAAYMFDDGLMVGTVVATLQHRKMQETHGRWLKLVSGGVILSLGVVMLARPSWIGMGG